MQGKKSMQDFYLYILRCSNGSYYVGHTDNIEKRVAEHNEGMACVYTAQRRPVALVYVENYASRDEAFVAEHQIKKWSRVKKEAYIQQDWNLLKKLSQNRVERAHGSMVRYTDCVSTHHRQVKVSKHLHPE